MLLSESYPILSYLHLDMQLTKSFNLSDIVQKPRLLEHHYDDIVRGFLKQKINLIGYSNEVSNYAITHFKKTLKT